MSFSVTLPPLPYFCFLTFCTMMPWRRREALTAVSLTERSSPRITLPPLSRPSQMKLNSLGPPAFAAAAVAIARSPIPSPIPQD
ncbi:hypothetical protein D3C83_31770 [compost metagenome]